MLRSAACFLLLAGCAGMASNDCAADAYQLGERDGVLGSNELGRHIERCGSGFSETRYREGYADARSRRPIPLW